MGMFDFDEDPIPVFQSPRGNAAHYAKMQRMWDTF